MPHNRAPEGKVDQHRAGRQAIGILRIAELVDLPTNLIASIVLKDRIGTAMSNTGSERRGRPLVDAAGDDRQHTGGTRRGRNRSRTGAFKGLKHAHHRVTVDDNLKTGPDEGVGTGSHAGDVATVMVYRAHTWQENRGAHVRNDVQKRDNLDCPRQMLIARAPGRNPDRLHFDHDCPF